LRGLLSGLLAIACAGCAAIDDKPPVAPATAAAPEAVAATPEAVPVKPKPPPPVSPPPPPEPTKEAERSLGADELAKGVKSYDDGDHAAAAKQFQAALDLGLASPQERVAAHKHLAFLACGAKRIATCRSEFRKALAADAAFDLTRAEAGHPTWGPVFRKVKAQAGKTKRK
jgi:hypothetical protein